MSVNIRIIGERRVVVKDHPEIEDYQEIRFNVLQTPTAVTDHILSLRTQEEKIEAYKKWADHGHHIELLDKFLQKCKEGYYTIDIYGV